MGGQIKVQSVKDKGTKFWFLLPIAPLVSANNNEEANEMPDS